MNKRQKKKFRKKFGYKKWYNVDSISIITKLPPWAKYVDHHNSHIVDFIRSIEHISITRGPSAKPDYERMEIKEIPIDNEFKKKLDDAIHWLSGIDRGGNNNEQASEEEVRKEEHVQDILWISTSGDISKNIQAYRPKE